MTRDRRGLLRRRTSIVPALCASLLVAGVVFAAPALAACGTFTLSTGTLNVSGGTIKRNGDNIQVDNVNCTSGATVATIDNVDKIVVTSGAVIVDLTGGRLAPGMNSDDFGVAEIEVDATAATSLTILGQLGNDDFYFEGFKIDTNGDLDGVADSSQPGDFTVDANTPATVSGGDGSDHFSQGSVVGNQTMNGNAGIDSIEYPLRTAAVTINLAASTAGQSGETDVINDFERAIGGSGADTITGNSSINLLFGNGGADIISGGDGDDSLHGEGISPLNGSAGGDTLNGDGGSDILMGEDGPDIENGGSGNDTFDQGAATNGGDTMDGGANTDSVRYLTRTNAVTVTMDGTANDGEAAEADNITATVENVTGGAGNDNLTGNTSANTLNGGRGTDTLNGGDGKDSLLGGSGADTINGGNQNDDINGGGDADNVSGGAGKDNISGKSGNDVTLAGDAGADQIYGGAGNDTLNGGTENDRLYGGGDDDALDGAAGDDLNNGGPGTGDDCHFDNQGTNKFTQCEA